MEEQQILDKMKRCEEDLKRTNSPYRRRDLEKYRSRLKKQLNKERRRKHENQYVRT